MVKEKEKLTWIAAGDEMKRLIHHCSNIKTWFGCLLQPKEHLMRRESGVGWQRGDWGLIRVRMVTGWVGFGICLIPPRLRSPLTQPTLGHVRFANKFLMKLFWWVDNRVGVGRRATPKLQTYLEPYSGQSQLMNTYIVSNQIVRTSSLSSSTTRALLELKARR